MNEQMKIALICTGLGRVVRGFESFTTSLFEALKRFTPEIDVTLFQGGGNRREGRVIVPNLHRSDVPARWFSSYTANLLEQRSYALCLYPRLIKGKYQLVHYNELVMGSTLFHLRRWFGGKFKLLYCNGAPSPPLHYHHRCDFVQIITQPAYEEASRFGIPENRLFLIPYGIDAKRFSPGGKCRRREIRSQLGIPIEAKVVLYVAALKRNHKRLEYLINEIAGLNDSIWLLAAGQRTDETESLEEEAEQHLSNRWRFITWSYENMHLLYDAADVFVLPSLTEGFGLVTVEAMLCELPVIVQKNEVNKWLTRGTSARLIDMSISGELRETLMKILGERENGNMRGITVRRFGWENILCEYLIMYRKILARSPGEAING
jgi:1,2-diacylglycerol 3-alpha-glucosyltransferase